MFQNPVDDHMLSIGAVTPSSARIWARSNDASGCEVRWQAEAGGPWLGREPIDLTDDTRDRTSSVELVRGLTADRRYRVALFDRTGAELASGRFHTAPPPGGGDRYAFALVSCHQPFGAHGELLNESELALSAACRAFEEHDVRHIVMAGDQLYADMPGALSLFNDRHFATVAPAGRDSILDCSEQEVRGLFHQRYRHFWSVPGWRRLMSRYPCYPILDDHEIVDNWGSAEEHSEPHWQSFRRGAFKAYCDYQDALVHAPRDELPDYLDYTLAAADTATYVMDLRSRRRVGEDSQVVSQAQLDALAAFLEDHDDTPVLFVVLSVPVVHLSRRLSQTMAAITPDGEDFSDRWSSRGHGTNRDQLLQLLRRHQLRAPAQRIVLLSGDIHIGCLHEIRWEGQAPTLYQFVSSGITHDAGTFVQVLSSLIICANRHVRLRSGTRGAFRLVKGEGRPRKNPCGRLNFGIVEIERRGPAGEPALRLLLYSHRGDQPSLSYRSPAIPLTRGTATTRADVADGEKMSRQK